MKLFVWEDVACDYTCGIACVLAHNEKEAFELLYQEDVSIWSEVVGHLSEELEAEIYKKVRESAIIIPGGAHSIDFNTECHKYLQEHKLYKFPDARNPEVVTTPKAFTVHGGG